MRMYSADIFITANVAILAQNEQEAFEMVKKMKDTPLTVPEDELFTDRFFDDPLVPDFSFATTFTFWKMLGDSQLTDHGAAENYIDLTAFARKDPKRHVFSGTALLGSTVYIKASRRSKAEAIFQRVNRANLLSNRMISEWRVSEWLSWTGFALAKTLPVMFTPSSSWNVEGSAQNMVGRLTLENGPSSERNETCTETR